MTSRQHLVFKALCECAAVVVVGVEWGVGTQRGLSVGEDISADLAPQSVVRPSTRQQEWWT